MIRTLVNYVGRKIEVLLYAVDELMEEEEKKAIPNNAAKFKGIFNKDEADKFNSYIKQARNEWDRDF
jgi:hypothetical protein